MPSVKYVQGTPITDADPLQVQVMAALPAGANNIGDVDVVSMPSLPAGTAVIGGVNPPLLEMILHPWAKGALTVDGVQYGAEFTTADDNFLGFDAMTITQPTGYTLYEVELGLTQAIKSSAAVEGVNWKWQASDAGALWTDLIASTLRAASCAAYLDVTCSGRFAPTGNFLGMGASFQVRAAIQSAVAAGETASGKTKNSSYVICRYRRA